ncbi:MAG: hypothetical protein ABL949_00780 [Fimbriimonadaceae bacterium]
MKLTRLFAAGAVAIVSVSAQAQISKQGAGYLFRLKFKPGAVVKQKMVMNMNMGMQQTMTSTISQKVISVDSKGVGTLKVTTSGMAMNGKPSNMGAQTATVKMDSRGAAVGQATSAGNFGSMMMPKDAIKVGTKWTGEVKVPQAQGTMNANYVFKGVRTIGGIQVAEIGLTMKMSGMMPLTGTGTMFVRTDNGMSHSMSMKMSGNFSAGQGGKPIPVTMNITMTPA